VGGGAALRTPRSGATLGVPGLIAQRALTKLMYSRQGRNYILPPFDFTVPLSLSVDERFDRAIELLRHLHEALEQQVPGFSSTEIPTSGLAAEELAKLENEQDVHFPNEHRAFLRRWRYLKVSEGHDIHGIQMHNGVYQQERPWVSSDHAPGRQHLVVGYWNQYADGDELLMDLEDEEQRVYLYLREAWIY
jgi:hypothetical protein